PVPPLPQLPRPVPSLPELPERAVADAPRTASGTRVSPSGGLPFTGFDALPLAALGVTLTLVGGVAVAGARRRSHRS
ncbi:hypothetical protein ACSNOI_46745, partial [Actinomadura kijaniata]|uniref:hypothetical protein n=1 Tax=Actinomadura kijaniata TaxID=46161 RepID=UPI003F1C152D